MKALVAILLIAFTHSSCSRQGMSSSNTAESSALDTYKARKLAGNKLEEKVYADAGTIKAFKKEREVTTAKPKAAAPTPISPVVAMPAPTRIPTPAPVKISEPQKPKTVLRQVADRVNVYKEKALAPAPKPIAKTANYDLSSIPVHKKRKPKENPYAKRKSAKSKSTAPQGDGNDELFMLAMSAGESNGVNGRDGGYESSGDNLLKLGSEYFAVIKDKITVGRGEKHYVVVDIVGRMSGHTVNVPFKMFAEVTLNSRETRVMVNVINCIDPSGNTRAIPIKGIVKGLDGDTGLDGDIYSPFGWGALVKTLFAATSQWSLASMTRSVTQSGTLADQTTSNAMWETLASGWKTAGDEIAANINRRGTTITVEGGSVVKVLITEDAVLWADK